MPGAIGWALGVQPKGLGATVAEKGFLSLETRQMENGTQRPTAKSLCVRPTYTAGVLAALPYQILTKTELSAWRSSLVRAACITSCGGSCFMRWSLQTWRQRRAPGMPWRKPSI